MVRQCRMWLPQQICVLPSSPEPLALLGWANMRDGVLDLVVAAALPLLEESVTLLEQIQAVLDITKLKLPANAGLCIVGLYMTGVPGCEASKEIQYENDSPSVPCSSQSEAERTREPPGECQVRNKSSEGVRKCLGKNCPNKCFRWSRCTRLRYSSYGSIYWAVVSAHPSSFRATNVGLIPKLSCFLWHGSELRPKTHIILYQQPSLSTHHFSILKWSLGYIPFSGRFRESQRTSVQKPKWWDTHDQQSATPDIEMVMTQLNCCGFIDQIVKDIICNNCNSKRCHANLAYPMASVVSLCATLLYGLAWSVSQVLDTWFPALPVLGSPLQMSVTWQIIHVRCQQLMAWPFVLLWGGLGPAQPNVATARKVAFRKHGVWSALVLDIILGVLVGCVVLSHQMSITQSLINMAKTLTNDVLRTGCVWLMGVPAGFKLNNELASTFGILSLHVVQAWSTLWYSLTPLVGISLQALALTSCLLGISIPAALVLDILYISTMHISGLHHAISLLYCNQLKALAALWRLFRGWKRNSLRGRLDTFNCSVEQLVVGSLMFTPLLLLLPTTSIFYTFFSIVYLLLSSIQWILFYIITALNIFPFWLIAMRAIRPMQFSSGVWFETYYACQFEVLQASLSCSSGPENNSTLPFDKASSIFCPSENRHGTSHGNSGLDISDKRCHFVGMRKSLDTEVHLKGTEVGSLEEVKFFESESSTSSDGHKSVTVLSTLGVTSASFGQLFSSVLQHLTGEFQTASAVSLAYKIVCGEILPMKMRLRISNELPYTTLSCKMFAALCYDAVLASFIGSENK